MSEPTAVNLVQSSIPRISDPKANAANVEAIDKLVETDNYRYVVAWGKWLGFTPEAVLRTVQEAEAESAPDDAIQKISGKWLRPGDIANATHKRRVESLAARV